MAIPAVVQEALDRYKLSLDADDKQRKREIDALEFQVPEKQWPEEAINARAGQTYSSGNITMTVPARPRLSIPKLDQPIQLVLNQEKAAHLGIQVHALTEDADDDTAEMLQGLYRRIEVDSRANLARSWAFERAVKAGTGAYRVLKEYDRDGGHPSDQKIVIKRLLHQESARFDPFATEPDKSDADWGFVSEWIPLSRLKRLHPKSKLIGMDDGAFGELLTQVPEWIRTDKAGKAALVVEYFRKEYKTRTLVALDDGSSSFNDEIPEGRKAAEGDGAFSREDEDYVVVWSKLTAIEELDTEEWDGRYIPIIPTIGRELIPFDQERRFVGIIEPNMDAQRMFNYCASTAVEIGSMESKAGPDLDPEEIEGFEVFWQQRNLRNFPFLPRRKFLHGTVYPPPQTLQADTSKLQTSMLLLQQADTFLHAGTGAFEPSLGQSSPNAKTKGGTLALQAQHDEGNSNWLDNLAEISLTYEAKVVLDLIPHVYDRPGRVARILDIEDNSQTVMLNKPFIMGPNKRPMAAPPQPPQMPGQPPQPMPGQPIPGQPPMSQAQPQPEVKHYDLKKGRYGVTVSVGKAYKSRVEQGADELGQLFQAEPQLFSILGDIYLKFRDFPGHMEAAERVKKMLPAPLQDQGDPQASQQEAAQLKGQLQQMQGELQKAGQIIQTKQVEQQAKIAAEKISSQAAITMQAMKDATSVTVAQINAMTKGVQMQSEAQNEAQALGRQHAFDANQGTQDRAHDVAMLVQDHSQKLQQAQQAHDQALQQGELATAQDAALADQGQQHALEQGQQAADLAPPPASENGTGT